jgi:hypothetical protein
VDFCLVGVEVPWLLDVDDLRDREGSKGPSSGDAKTVGRDAECGITGLPDGDPAYPIGGR